MQKFHSAVREVFSIGCGNGILLSYLTKSLRTLIVSCAVLLPRLPVVSRQNLLPMLKMDDVDAILDICEGEQIEEKIACQELIKSRLVCVCSQDHPLTAKEYVTAQDLAQEKLIICTQGKSSDFIGKLAEGRAPEETHFCAAGDAAVTLACSGFGVAILPDILVPYRQDLAQIRLDGAPELSLGLLYKSDNDDAVLQEFLGITKRDFEEMA